MSTCLCRAWKSFPSNLNPNIITTKNQMDQSSLRIINLLIIDIIVTSKYSDSTTK